MDTRSFMLGVMMGDGGGGGGGATTEEGDFSVAGGYSSIPVQMDDYDVLVAYASSLGYTNNSIIGHVETPLWSLDVVATINGTSYSIPTTSGTMARKSLNGKGNPYNGTWHYVAIKFNS